MEEPHLILPRFRYHVCETLYYNDMETTKEKTTYYLDIETKLE